MKNNNCFKQDLEDFLSNRIEESYKIVIDKKEYIELNQRYKALEQLFIESLKDKNQKEIYQKLRDIRMELDSQELEEAYLIGFRDSSKINNNNF